VASANASDSLRITATRFPRNVLLVGRYQISNPSYCLAKKPSYAASNYDQWVSKRCATGTTSPKGSYDWTVTLIDPYHRSGYNISRHGAFSCQ
jgi:hypothetical protein